ncbi:MULTISPECIES: MFS transporter [Pseudomonas]|jgi:MFS transporter, DHA2 family, multidrug resistance protein|uniref:MFS transporter n=1 Tax=Pseudomonas fragi TaxID=296 RepID=A0A9Q5AYX9_PSEFR|nr:MULTISPECIES: MFS transporter [Pseudomonas]AOA05380.1 multidrug MFS transporter [Pseudomonas sp. TMW 2.1634]ARQ74891.1 MFS transporter [Pseudomonas fragi]ASC85524.1 MFS transporter [Pseudomonas fragi]MBM1202009.1 MFS transporter [Pseudomonas fragi]NNA83688.1 MFS transporter [Pseudomonas fragi]
MSSIADGLPSNKRLPAVIAISLGIGMATLDTAIVNTALPTLAEGIGTDSASVIWVVNAYQLATIAAVLPFASLSDVLGHRRVFLGGLLVFIVASLFCGLAWSLPTLTAARVVQGLGAAAIMSVNIALLRHIYPAKILGRGLGYNSLVVGLAFTLGPTAASAILAVTTWHWLYLINVPLGLLAVVLGLRSLPEIPRSGHAFDRLAAILCAGLFALLVLGLGSAVHGAEGDLSLGLVAVALVCGVWLMRRQADHPAPMLAIDLFKRPLFALSSLTAICAFCAQGLAFVSLPFLLQTALGHSQVATGFLMTPWPAVVAVMALIAGRLADRVSLALLCGIGLLLLSAGMAALALLSEGASAFDIGWRMALCGAGFGFFQSPNLKAIMTSAPLARSGGASGIVATSRLMGQTLGASLVALCFHLSTGSGPQLALWLGCVFALAGALASGLRLMQSPVALRS